MQRNQILAKLKEYILYQVLDGKAIGLDETTPLLEWGVINSIEIVHLLSFIQKEFAIEISPGQMTADHFSTLGTITDLVLASSVSSDSAQS